MRNSKYAARESSGKFVTIYPHDETELQRALRDLDEQLGGVPGPYILSDLRWHEGPLFVRYGGFAPRHTYADDGALVPAIAQPDGELVPDVREPRFTVPDWVTVPSFLASQAQDRITAAQPDEFPYAVLQVLNFPNGGGVYLARRLTDGCEIVLKEARPHAGLDISGRDARERLRSERDVLWSLQGVEGRDHPAVMGDQELRQPQHGAWPRATAGLPRFRHRDPQATAPHDDATSTPEAVATTSFGSGRQINR